MTPERWAQIEELFHRAAECDPQHRASLLDDACNGDPQLRDEVEALLSCDETARDCVQTAVHSELNAWRFPLIGETVSHYRIVDGLGGGGMGLVYRAEDIRLGRRVALKFLPEESAKDLEALKRFEREARSASALEHPNICPIYEFGEHEGQPFLVMPLLEGQTLQELVIAAGSGKAPFEPHRLLDLAIQIADGLDAAHKKGILHRDIKPANIFVTSQGQAKILDFGLAKLATVATVAGSGLEPEPSENGDDVEGKVRPALLPATRDPFLSRTGMALGTAGYMSPEQARGEPLDARTDLFSFGLVLYEMAIGKRAFTGHTGRVLQEANLEQVPCRSEDANPKLHPKLEKIIGRALEKERSARYQSASEMRVALERLKRALAARVLSRKWAIVTGTVAAAAVVTALVVGSRLSYFHEAHTLTEKDTIVLADFTNTTGDAVLEGTLREGLSVQLEQSPFLSIVSDQQIQQTLRMMGQNPGVKLTSQIAREICQRTGSAAVLEGSMAQIGTQYLLTLKAVDCVNGRSLASSEGQASDKNHVLEALGKVASGIRNKLGESLNGVQKFDTPIEMATTSSLEALQAYSLGRRKMLESDFAAAVPLFRRAVSLDPNFAIAYSSLGNAYWYVGETNLGAENAKKAYELRERESDREKFYIECNYYWATGDLERARRTYELWAQTYPRDDVPETYLSAIDTQIGEHDKALAEAQEALRRDPINAVNYASLASSYLNLNRLDRAWAIAEEAQEKNLDSQFLRLSLYELAFLRNDAQGMAKQVAWSIGKLSVEDMFLASESNTAAYFGRLDEAREFSRRAVASAERAEEKETAAVYEAERALWEALMGNAAESRQQVAAALDRSNGRDVRYIAALALAFMGNAIQAETLADDLGKRFPRDTLVKFKYLPTIRAQLALTRNDPPRAINILQMSAPYELGQTGGALSPAMHPVYVRGNSYLAVHQEGKAVTEFHKILDQRSIVQNDPIGALAYVGLAHAYVLQGDTTKARAVYQDFLTLWKDADPDIPILKQAKAEYASLR